jgi:hypothetical protein
MFQHRIVAGNGKAGRSVRKGLGHALVEPVCRAVEGRILGVLIAHQRRRFVVVEGGDQAAARQIGMFGDQPDERHGRQRRRHDELLAFLQVEPDLDRHLGELFQLVHVDDPSWHRRALAFLHIH